MIRICVLTVLALLTCGLAHAGSYENGAKLYQHTDHLGSPVAGTDATGSVAWRERYTLYGEKLLKPDALNNQASFTGHIFDEPTGLTYMQARYYDPNIGRFLSIDPVTFLDTGDPAMFGRYTYCYNDPINCTDPDGEFGNFFTGVVGAGIGGIFGAASSIYSQHKAGNGISIGRVIVDTGKGAAVGGVTGFAGPAAGAAVATGLGGLDGGISTAIDGGSAGEIAANALGSAFVEGASAFAGGKVGEKVLGDAIAPKLSSLVRAENVGNLTAAATGVGLQTTINAGGELAGAAGEGFQDMGAAIGDAVGQLSDMMQPEPTTDPEREY